MIGDRLLTDIVFGNLNGMFTIYVDPIETKTEPFGVRFVHKSLTLLLTSVTCRQGVQKIDYGPNGNKRTSK